MLGSIGGVATGLTVTLAVACGIGMFIPKDYVVCKEIELVAMQDNEYLQGSFFLGSGYIESELYYVFYQKEGSGIKFNKIPRERVVIYEEERNDGVMKIYIARFKPKWCNAIALSRAKCRIFIPKGTIIQKFNLDLK